ncbi:MAG: hypothetical protein IJH63_10340 [Methanobrevibacter sp.]|nr:hypothetical protein [Methanosphaera sp.]MBR0371098.1 hypothetical protein [Methanobrevibacter sp.]
MTNYTTTSLIELLKQFPEDTPVNNELALMWNFPEELKKHYNKDMTPEEYSEYESLTIANATDLCIFEGDWSKGTVTSDYTKYQK